MPENEEAYFRQAVAGALAYKDSEDTASSLDWIDDIEGIAINGGLAISIRSLTKLAELSIDENGAISTKARSALETAMEIRSHRQRQI